MKKAKSYLALIVLALAFAMGASDLQAQCPGGSGCTACRPTVTSLTKNFCTKNLQNGYTFYVSNSKTICANACSYATGAGSYEWMVMDCMGATIGTQGSGNAAISFPASCANITVGFRFKAITQAGTACWSPWLMKTFVVANECPPY